MFDSNSIKQNLLQIKNSQLQLLQELKSEHSILQGYISNNDSSIENNKVLQNSLQFSRSENRQNDLHPLVEEKYKKIQQLLLKQRKMQQESHALHRQNQSLIIDYRELKKLYNKQKQQSNKLQRSYGHLGQFYHSLLTQVLLGVSHEQLVLKYKQVWKSYEKTEPLVDSNWQRKSLQLLSQKYKVKAKKQVPQTQKSMMKEIDNLKREIGLLISTKQENEKLKKGNRRISIEFDEKMEEVKKVQGQADRKIRLLQNEIIDLSTENVKLKEAKLELRENILNKDNQTKKIVQNNAIYDDKLVKYDSENKVLKKSLKEKEDIIMNQNEISKKQKYLMDRMEKDIAILKEQINKMHLNRQKEQGTMTGKQESMKQQVGRISHQYNRYRQNSQRQICSLKQYINELKKQYDMLVKSQQKIKNHEIKYKEMMSKQGVNMKINTSIDHLWQVKEIQYANIINHLKSVHQI